MTAMTTVTTMTTTRPTAAPTSVAEEVLSRLETAWNAGDGQAFGDAYADDASFVTIHGQHIVGAAAIGAGHAGIFTTIYAGSVNRMDVMRVEPLADGVLLVLSTNTLSCPGGPLAGVHRARSTSVVTRSDDDGVWRVVSTHNTLMAA